MAKGGRRPGAGRKPGSANKKTIAAIEAAEQAAEIIREHIPDAFEGNGHALMMAIYKDPKHEIDLRLEAAKAAAPYEKPRLSSVEAKVEQDTTVHDERDPAEWLRDKLTRIAPKDTTRKDH